MKTKDRQIGWHLFLVVVVFLLLMPIVFAISNSFKTMQEAFNTVFQGDSAASDAGKLPACI